MSTGLEIVYEYESITPWEVWSVIYEELDRQSLLSEKYAVNQWNMKPSKIAEHLESRNEDWFSINDGTLKMMYTDPMCQHTLVTLEVEILHKKQIDVDWNGFAERLAELGRFKMAWVIDLEYFMWQTEEDLEEYIESGYPARELKMKPSGMSAPFDADIIDTSDNPGRRIIHPEGYVEAVGHKMWIGDELYPLTGASREDLLSAADWLLEVKETDRYIYLKAAEEPFVNDTGASRDLQDRLRALVFPNDVKKG